MSTQQEINKFMKWRNEQRQKHRIMTIHEYQTWCKSGDSISHPYNSNAFPGGITINFNTSSTLIIGKVRE